MKTSLAPGSRVVMDYYDRAGLTPYLDKLGFSLVGYGCTTCIGNSGPLIPAVSAAIAEGNLAVCSVLSGNRNFEGRIHPETKLNYLASPPLVVAYALAGTMDTDLAADPLGTGSDGQPVYLRDIWPSAAEIGEVIASCLRPEMYIREYAEVFAGDERWRSLPVPAGDTFAWDPSSTYVRRPPFFDGLAPEPGPLAGIEDARVLALLGDSVTTDHISPAGAIKADSPAGGYLIEHGVQPRDFNSYGSRRGNHEVMIRGTFANIRLRNQLAPGTEGGFTRHLPSGEQMTIFDAAQRYAAEDVPLLVIAGAGVRLRLVPGLGGERHRAARRAGGPRRLLRAHPPIQPDRHGRAPAAVRAGSGRHLARADRRGDLCRPRPGRGRGGAAHGHGRRRRAWRDPRVRRDRTDRHPRRGRLLPARRHPPLRAARPHEPLSGETCLATYGCLADILPTGYEVGVLGGGVRPGDVVAVAGGVRTMPCQCGRNPG